MITNETRPSIAETFSSGQKVGDGFTLKQKLSTGDIGVTWLAHDEESGGDVSLLFLPDALLSENRVIEELRAQVKLNRQLVHPHVLRTRDFIEEPGWAAISFDCAEGDTLASLLARKDRGCFEAPEIQPWITTICQTLDDAHRANLLHSDLSPVNFLLKKSGGLLVANFGISRIILDALSRAKGAGEIDDHPAYVSPQQLDGEFPARWDDVYGMGVLIYELLTGKPPFYSGDLVTQIRKAVPVSMAARRAELGIKGQAIPESWEKVVASCLSKHTPARPKSAREVGVKLGAAISLVSAVTSTPPAAAPPETSPKTSVPPATPVTPASSKAAVSKDAPSPAPVGQKHIPPVSKPAQKPVPAGVELDEDILWRTNEPKSRHQPNPASPFAHLLEKLPDEPRGHGKPSAFPLGKAVGIGVAVIVAMLVIVLSRHKEKPAQHVSATATPAAASSVAMPSPGGASASSKSSPAQVPADVKPMATLPPGVPADKVAALTHARATLEAIEKSHQEKLKAQQQADAEAAQAQKALDDKLAAVASLKKAADEAAELQKQREDAEAKAAADAEAARKAADEKGRIADEAKKAKEQILGQIKEQQAARQKADAELPALQKAAVDKSQIAATAANAEKDALAQLQLQQLAVSQAQAEAVPAATPVATPSSTPAVVPSASLGSSIGTLTPITPEKITTSGTTIEEAEKLVLSQISQRKVKPEASPFVSTVPVTYVANPRSQVDKKLENSLGMKFAPVGDLLFAIWPVRVKDFETFAEATNFKSTAWRQPGFKQGPDHPVVNVTWPEAVAFCKWLTEKEQKSGMLAPNQVYRLPTDLEWSKAVGLPDESGRTAEARDMDIPDVYPWGTQWPPPPGAGNYTGEETGSDVAIKGYEDGYAWTSPVGSFNPNKYGLYDMGGNVWQWCSDWWNGEQKLKVLRGASWYNGGLKLSLLSSSRWTSSPDITTDNYGFRCVVAPEGKPRK